MYRRGLLVLLSVALLSPCAAAAQGTAVHAVARRLQMPTAAQVSAVWRNPPPEYGPQPYFDMSGAVDEAEVEHDLDQMTALGFRAVTVQAGVNLPFEYLSEGYFRFFRMLVAEAKKRDMRMWIVDDIGYPSGFAGGKFTCGSSRNCACKRWPSGGAFRGCRWRDVAPGSVGRCGRRNGDRG